MAKITCSHLRKSYGALEIVRDFSLEVDDHEFIVFLGPSGCGKSTILRMIAGLEDISGGTLTIGERVVNDLLPRDRNVAMVFQNYALYPHMTVFDNIAFGLRRLKTSEAEISRRVGEVAEILSLQPYLSRQSTQLSGGQQQRVAIARAMIKTPQVFLFDEPLSNLDAKLRGHMRIEIARLHRKLRTTTIYVTHDQLEAMTLADRIVLLNGGDVEQIGSPVDIYERPESVFVAGFIGTPPMNLVAATLRQTGDAWYAVSGDAALAIDPGIFALEDGAAVTLGLRPADLALAGDGGTGDVFTGTVELIEFLGRETLAQVTLLGGKDANRPFAVLLPLSRSPNAGSSIRLTAPSDRLHLFDSATGRTLRKPS